MLVALTREELQIIRELLLNLDFQKDEKEEKLLSKINARLERGDADK